MKRCALICASFVAQAIRNAGNFVGIAVEWLIAANRDWKSPRACAMINALHERRRNRFCGDSRLPLVQEICCAVKNEAVRNPKKMYKRKEIPYALYNDFGRQESQS